MRDRWKHIRTAFGRSLKPSKSKRSKKPYYLTNELEFLRPYMRAGEASGNIPQPEEESDDTTEVLVETQGEDENMSDISERASIVENVMQDQRPLKKRTKISHEDEADQAFIEWLQEKKQRNHNKRTLEEEDGDWLFLQSLLPDMKKLSDRGKRVLKAKYLLFLNEQLDEEDKERLHTTPASSIQWPPSASSTPLPNFTNYSVDVQLPKTELIPDATSGTTFSTYTT